MKNQSRNFLIGQRIRISTNGTFAKGTIGTISNAPEQVLSMSDGWVRSYKREMDTPTRGRKTFYWILFDSPEFDEVGDGPYKEAEIEISYIEPI